MAQYIPSFPEGCFRDWPTLAQITTGTAPAVNEFLAPVLAVALAAQATEDTLSPLVAYFQELSKQYPAVIAVFLAAVSTHRDKAKFYAANRDFISAAAKVSRCF